MKLPSKVKIGHHIYNLSRAKEVWIHTGPTTKQGCYGIHDYTEQNIAIKNGLQPSVEKNTVIHELLHALLYQCHFDFEKGITEEELVSRLSPVLTTLLIDNPKLVNYLMTKGE